MTRAGLELSWKSNRTESCLYFNNIIYVHVFAFNRNQKRSESKPDNASGVRRMGNASQGNESGE